MSLFSGFSNNFELTAMPLNLSSLFGNDLNKEFESRKLSARIDILNLKEIPSNIDEYIKSLLQKYKINPVVLNENIIQGEAKHFECSEITEISNMLYQISDGISPLYAKMQKISIEYSIYFEGDKELFLFQSSSTLLPYHLKIQSCEIQESYVKVKHNLYIDNFDKQKEQAEKDNKKFFDFLKQNLSNLDYSIDYFNNSLKDYLKHILEKQIKDVEKLQETLKKLKIPLPKENEHEKQQTEVKRETKKVINKEPFHKEIAKKGGIERHKTTNIIKNEIIKKMLEKTNGLSVHQKATKINNTINEVISKNEFEKLAKRYEISIQLTKEIKEYLKRDHFEQIYKWCLNFNKIKQ